MPYYDCRPEAQDIFLVERPLGFIVEAVDRVEAFPFATHLNALHAAEDFITAQWEGEAVWFCQAGEPTILHEFDKRPVEGRYDSHPEV